MRQSDVRKQFKAAVRNAESAVQDLADRFDDLQGGGSRSAIRRARKSLRRSAGTFADRVPFDRATAFAADTGRRVREHPVRVLVTAAVAGYCVWALLRYATERNEPGQARIRATDDLDELQPDVEAPGESADYARH
jgi:ElaB/YqjD/DUF883 family membrane-anchored ribosome-binding protein